MSQISEKRVWHVNGWAMVLAELLLVAGCVQLVLSGIRTSAPNTVPVALLWAVPLVILFMVVMQGFFLIHPNEAKVFVFLGRYIGSARNAGFHWANPFAL